MAKTLQIKRISRKPSKAEIVLSKFMKVVRERTEPRDILALAKGNLTQIDVRKLTEQSREHHSVEKRLLELAHRYAVLKGARGEVKFPKEMADVIRRYSRRPEPLRLAPELQGEHKIAEVVYRHHSRVVDHFRKAEEIMSAPGVNGVIQTERPMKLAA